MAEMSDAVAWRDRLAKQLRDRIDEIQKHDRYYRGEHRLAYASEQFSKFFADRYRDWCDNWCGVVADAPTERLEVIGIRLDQPEPDGPDPARPDLDLWRVWRANEADFYSDLAFLDAIVARRAFGLVWGNPSDQDTPQITFEHPTQAIVAYDPATRRRAAGLKLWIDDDREFATVYLPDSVWKFVRERTTEKADQLGLILPSSRQPEGKWAPREVPGEPWPLPNPMGEVPLVELENRPRLLGPPMSDIGGTIAMQDAVNLLWAYLFNAADFASFPQRIVLGAERPKIPILNDDGDVIGDRPIDLEKFAVDRVLWVTDPNAKVDEWTAANLDVYSQVIREQVDHIAAQTRTPPHYLIGKMSNVSAESLKAAETGLVKRTEEKAETFGRGIREMFRLVALAQGEKGKADAVRTGRVLWRDIESRSEAQRVDKLTKLQSVGFPFEWLAEEYGLGPPDIARLQQMRQSEMQMAMAAADTLLDREPQPDASPPVEPAGT